MPNLWKDYLWPLSILYTPPGEIADPTHPSEVVFTPERAADAIGWWLANSEPGSITIVLFWP